MERIPYTVLLCSVTLLVSYCGAVADVHDVIRFSPGPQRTQIDRHVSFTWRLNPGLMAHSEKMVMQRDPMIEMLECYRYQKEQGGNRWEFWPRGHCKRDKYITNATDSWVTFTLKDVAREDAGVKFKLIIYVKVNDQSRPDVIKSENRSTVVIEREPSKPTIEPSVRGQIKEGDALNLKCNATSRTLPSIYANRIVYTWKRINIDNTTEPIDEESITGQDLILHSVRSSVRGYRCFANEEASTTNPSSSDILLKIIPSKEEPDGTSSPVKPSGPSIPSGTSHVNTTGTITTLPHEADTSQKNTDKMPHPSPIVKEDDSLTKFLKYGIAAIVGVVLVVVIALLCRRRRRKSQKARQSRKLLHPTLMENGTSQTNKRYRDFPGSDTDDNPYYSIPTDLIKSSSLSSSQRELPPVPGDRPPLPADRPPLPADRPSLPGDRPLLSGYRPPLPGDTCRPSLPGDRPGCHELLPEEPAPPRPRPDSNKDMYLKPQESFRVPGQHHDSNDPVSDSMLFTYGKKKKVPTATLR